MEIELAKSDRSTCKTCGKKIGKDTPRLTRGLVRYNHTENSYHCHKCAKLILEEEENKIKEFKKILNKMTKKQNKQIILGEL